MNNNTTINKNILKISFLMALVFVGFLLFIPNNVKALTFNPLNPIDPFCLFSCDDDSDSQPTVQNITNTNSNNNNNNTTNSVVNNIPNTVSDHHYDNRNNGVAYVSRGIYVPDNRIYYDNGYNYNNYNYNNLSVSCYTSNTNVNVGDITTWIANVSGGNGSYNYNWYGTDGLSGYNSSISRSYSYTGTKSASVTVTSGGQTASANCNNFVNVNNYNNYYYNNNYSYGYNPIYAVCTPNITYTNTGSNVLWRVSVSGGNGYYTYSWSGTDGLYGSDNSVNMYYNTPGTKTAIVTVYSNGSQTSAQCSNVVVTGNNLGYYNYNNNYAYNPNDIQIACSVGKVSSSINTPVTWTSEVAPLGQNYTYSWSGTDGISGNGSSLVTSYSTAGTKSAILTVTAPNGISKSKNCENTVYISSGIASKKPNTKIASNNNGTNNLNTNNSNNDLSAATLLSLKGVPWGWIAIIVILILFGTVIYLLVNRKKM